MLLWVLLRPAVSSRVRTMMVPMPVGLLPLLAGRPLLSRRRRAVVLREGRDRRRQNEAKRFTPKNAPTTLRFVPIMLLP
jgi:hypothetical protein